MTDETPSHPSDPTPSSNKPIEESSKEQIIIDSQNLLQGRKEIFIRHNNDTYRLRLTRSGKLLLQK